MAKPRPRTGRLPIRIRCHQQEHTRQAEPATSLAAIGQLLCEAADTLITTLDKLQALMQTAADAPSGTPAVVSALHRLMRAYLDAVLVIIEQAGLAIVNGFVHHTQLDQRLAVAQCQLAEVSEVFLQHVRMMLRR